MGHGEDWEGLGRLVEKDPVMHEAEKQDILGIIKGSSGYDQKDRLVMQYNGGRTYRYMLSNLYPLLRKSVYRIEFTVPEYSLETVKEVYKTHPNMLSLFEFYLLANEYEPGSPQFREVIENAAKMFPNEKTNRLSMAMFSYLSGDMQAALQYLRGLEDDPDAWLYFSAFHARNNELDKAEQFARKALDAGNADATEYLKLIEKYRVEEESYQQKYKEWEKYGK